MCCTGTEEVSILKLGKLIYWVVFIGMIFYQNIGVYFNHGISYPDIYIDNQLLCIPTYTQPSNNPVVQVIPSNNAHSLTGRAASISP